VIPVAEIERARERLAGVAVRTPLVRFDVDGDVEIWLKLELLQPVRSFKIRGAGNAILLASDTELADGVWTTSAGNMAQGVAYTARLRGVPSTIVVPETAPRVKLDAIERYGGRIVAVPYDVWWETMRTRQYEGVGGLFVHPFDDDAVIAGNGTIGLELLEDLEDFDTIVVPYGGGGLIAGIASAVKPARPDVRVVAAEPATGAPATASLAAGRRVELPFTPSFVDGAGGHEVFENMWPRTQGLTDGGIALATEETAAAVRLLVERTGVVAEGAGALAVAAALSRRLDGARKVVAIVSGANIDTAVLGKILAGELP
jgi:threonine dehydratase